VVEEPVAGLSYNFALCFCDEYFCLMLSYGIVNVESFLSNTICYNNCNCCTL